VKNDLVTRIRAAKPALPFAGPARDFHTGDGGETDLPSANKPRTRTINTS
jgi:hypothetical protein